VALTLGALDALPAAAVALPAAEASGLNDSLSEGRGEREADAESEPAADALLLADSEALRKGVLESREGEGVAPPLTSGVTVADWCSDALAAADALRSAEGEGGSESEGAAVPLSVALRDAAAVSVEHGDKAAVAVPFADPRPLAVAAMDAVPPAALPLGERRGEGVVHAEERGVALMSALEDAADVPSADWEARLDALA
jgi:hypothetical protein